MLRGWPGWMTGGQIIIRLKQKMLRQCVAFLDMTVGVNPMHASSAYLSL